MKYYVGFKYFEQNTKEDLNTTNNLLGTGYRLSSSFLQKSWSRGCWWKYRKIWGKCHNFFLGHNLNLDDDEVLKWMKMKVLKSSLKILFLSVRMTHNINDNIIQWLAKKPHHANISFHWEAPSPFLLSVVIYANFVF